MGTTHHCKAVAQLRDAESARDELREALTEADVLLPSRGLDPVSLASGYLPPLVELGRCNPDVARQLAEVLRRRAT
ncbi:hypothetical protein OG217_24325 [Streptomyces sp. NBC_01023]|uniref:hypothetical protein n=1 Tax=Streptomyces sp. NBC_01023 TaxID=2903724 RepID=UPI00386C7E99|nr:hypothetical protein OG217_24325 [Streptomyces sp. NBC_01023]